MKLTKSRSSFDRSQRKPCQAAQFLKEVPRTSLEKKLINLVLTQSLEKDSRTLHK